MNKTRVVVAGGGFAGLQIVKHLDKKKFDVTVIDRNNYHSFPPLFYQVASSGLNPTDIAFPLRREFRRFVPDGTRFHMGQVKSVDVKAKTITTDLETIGYDILVMALGTTNNFFGNPEFLDKVYTLKSTDEAIRLRNETLHRLELASIEPDREKRRRMLSFTVVGGGPAGVEIAGALGEAKSYILSREYPTVPEEDMTINLLEGTDKLLRTMSPEASVKALEGLKKLKVNVMLGRLLKSYDDDKAVLDDGSVLDTGMMIWTAGVKATPVEFNGVAEGTTLTGPGGRIVTDDRLRVKGVDDIYAIGDQGYYSSDKYERGLPQLAQVAIQQGRYIAEALNTGDFSRPFSYRDKGSMATIGRNMAVADIGKLHLSGFMAWCAWMWIHLISLMGMRNKLNVLVNWIWAYFTHNTSMRMLFRGSAHPRRGVLDDKG